MERKKFHDPVIDLSRQFYKLMHGKHISPINDVFDKSSGKWTFVKDRYNSSNRIYQMQVDFMYLLKNVWKDLFKNIYQT